MVTSSLRIAAFIVVAAAGLAPAIIAPAFAADPLGTWLTGDKKGKVRIVNCGGAICGNLVWVDEPLDPETKKPKIDKRNADASKQGRPLLGIPIVLNMKPEQHAAVMGGRRLQCRGRQDLFRFLHLDRGEHRPAQGLRARRPDLQGADLDADELTAERRSIVGNERHNS